MIRYECCLLSSRKALYRAVASGRLRAARIGTGRSLPFSEPWIDEWLRTTATAVPAEEIGSVGSGNRGLASDLPLCLVKSAYVKPPHAHRDSAGFAAPGTAQEKVGCEWPRSATRPTRRKTRCANATVTTGFANDAGAREPLGANAAIPGT